MKDERIQIKGNKDGVNVIIDMEKFISFDDMLEVLISSLLKNKGFFDVFSLNKCCFSAQKKTMQNYTFFSNYRKVKGFFFKSQSHRETLSL